MKTIVIQMWLESERGWGTRPDGFSIHLSNTNCKKYCEEYWVEEKKRNAKSLYAPDEYSREDGEPKVIEVQDFVHDALVKNHQKGKFGFRFYDHSNVMAVLNDVNRFLL